MKLAAFRKFCAGIACVAVLQICESAHAQVAFVEGSDGSAVNLGVRIVPIPKGKWTIVGLQEAQSSKQNKLERVILAELDHNRLSRWIYINTNLENNRGGWKRNKDICDRRNVHFGYSDSLNTDKETECWIVNHWGETMGNNPNQAVVSFFRWSDTLGRPNTSVGSAFYIVKGGDFLTVELKYNPVVDGFPDTPTAVWRGNPWHPDVASKDPKKLEYLKALKAMSEQYFTQLKSVLH